MKRSLILVMAAALGGCGKVAPRETAVPEERPTLPVPATPIPAPVAAPVVHEPPKPVAVATPRPSYLAPEGVYFLVTPTSVETSSGIVGLKPGTKLQRLGLGMYQAGEHRLALRDDQVTNDVRFFQQLASATPAPAARPELPLVIQPASLPPEAPRAPESTATTTPPVKPGPTPFAPSKTLLEGPGSIGASHSNTREKIYIDSFGHRYWRDAKGRARYD